MESKTLNVSKASKVAFALSALLFSKTNAQACNAELYGNATTIDGRLVVSGPLVDYQNATIESFVELPPEADACTSGPLRVGLTVRTSTNATLFDWLGSLPNEENTMFNITDATGACKDQPLGPGCIPPNDLIPLPMPGTNTTFNPFVWIGLNWNPIGHPPLEVFNRAHFDVHLFMVPEAEVNAIVPSSEKPCTEGLSPESFYKANTPVPEGCFPQGFANLNAVAPFMGNHYILLDEPVVAAAASGNPDPTLWTDPSFIIGGYDGKITFLEPMIRVTQLQDLAEADGSQCFTPKVPDEYSNAGFYPSTFCVNTTDDSMSISMGGFSYQEAGCPEGTEMDQFSYINALPPPPGTPELPDYCKAPLYQAASAPTSGPTSAPTSAPTGDVMPKSCDAYDGTDAQVCENMEDTLICYWDPSKSTCSSTPPSTTGGSPVASRAVSIAAALVALIFHI